jgi:hypothetical protein
MKNGHAYRFICGSIQLARDCDCPWDMVGLRGGNETIDFNAFDHPYAGHIGLFLYRLVHAKEVKR